MLASSWKIYVLGILLVLLAPWAGAQEYFAVSIAERCERYCPVCASSILDNDTFGLFHQAHVHSKKRQFSELHGLLTAAIGAELFHDRDTLAYYAELMLAHALNELQLPNQSVQKYTAILQKWKQLSQDENLYIQTEVATLEFSLGKLEQALAHYRAVSRADAFQKAVKLQDAVFVGMGLCYQYKDSLHTDSAIAYFNKAVAVQLQQRDTVDLASTYLNLGSLYFMEVQDDSAKKYWDLAMALAAQKSMTDLLDDLHFNLAQYHEEAGNQILALNHYKLYTAYQDSIWNRDKIWELAEQKKQFEVQLKEDEILLLEKDKRLQDAELLQERSERNLLLGISTALIGVLVLVFFFYQNMRKKNAIIERQKAHLDQLNSTKNQLFSIVAHDLRSPVQALGRNNQRLQDQLEDTKDEAVKQLLQTNQQGIEGTYRLLDNLLHWSLSQSESLFLQIEKLKLKAIIDQVHYDFIGVLAQKDIQFENEVPANAFVQADNNTLKIVLRNLLDNAIRFTPQAGIIVFDLEEENKEQLVFSITDNGPGIDSEQEAALFEIPAAKKRSADTTGKVSSGLGLFLCRELMQQNLGSIAVDSNYTKGAKFIIRLNTAKYG